LNYKREEKQRQYIVVTYYYFVRYLKRAGLLDTAHAQLPNGSDEKNFQGLIEIWLGRMYDKKSGNPGN
jgi:hypothetical protein